MQSARLSYEESCKRLQPKFIDEGSFPPMPQRRPQANDEEPHGVSFFRTFVGEGEDLSNLTLPRTFFGRSEIDDASFKNTDLSESNLCWNDFTDVDFTDATLTGADLRASNYCRVNFTSADLTNADLRGSWFKDCNFDGTRMIGATLTRDQITKLNLSDRQRAEISWTDDTGPEPAGG
jgi:uncharacterized protein YjbI with pentapeptide repeats